MRKIMIISILLAIAGRMLGDNLHVSDAQLKAGEEKQISIELANPDRNYAAFQFDLILPEGVKIALNKKGKLNASLVEDRIDDHTMSLEELSEGHYRFLAFSMSNSEFYDSDGPLVNVTIKAEEDVAPGALTATITEQVFTAKDGIQYDFSDVTFNIMIEQVSGIEEILVDDTCNDVYSIDGVLYKKDVVSPNELPQGIYIINGRKYVVK